MAFIHAMKILRNADKKIVSKMTQNNPLPSLINPMMTQALRSIYTLGSTLMI